MVSAMCKLPLNTIQRLIRASTAFTSVAIATVLAAYAQEPRLDGVKPLNLPRTFTTNELPPEPSTTEHPHLHAVWAKIPNMQQITPKLERHEGIFHGPHAAPAGLTNGSAGDASSLNWSGTAIFGGINQYGTATVAMSVVVPSHHQTSGSNCNSTGTTYTATWVGTDGWYTGTVEQAGLWIGVSNCGQPFMSAFIEVYPDPEVAISNFPIAPGDTISVFSTTNQAQRTECAILVNESQNVVTTNTCLVAPGAFQARSIEWVVERPTYGNQYANLANYDTWPISNAWAWDSNNGHTLGAGAESPCYIYGAPCAQFNYINMMDNNLKMISYPEGFSPSVLIMHDAGSALCSQGASCVPQY